jgi:hypothetical protein
MASSSTTTVNSSRSPSPDTPDSDYNRHPFHVENIGWGALASTKPMPQNVWEIGQDSSFFGQSQKSEQDVMLRLDEVLERHAFEESVHIVPCTIA